MTMRWIAQASARGGEQSIISLVTSTWSCPAILFRAAFYFSKRGTFFRDYFLFFRKVSTREPPYAIFARPLPSASDPIAPQEAVNAAPDFRRIGVHKGARAAQFAPERCHSPSHTVLSKLLYMPLSDCPSKASAEPRWPWAPAKFGLMSGARCRPCVASGKPPSLALDAPMGCYRRVPPHGKLASIGIWLRANEPAP